MNAAPSVRITLIRYAGSDDPSIAAFDAGAFRFPFAPAQNARRLFVTLLA